MFKSSQYLYFVVICRLCYNTTKSRLIDHVVGPPTGPPRTGSLLTHQTCGLNYLSCWDRLSVVSSSLRSWKCVSKRHSNCRNEDFTTLQLCHLPVAMVTEVIHKVTGNEENINKLQATYFIYISFILHSYFIHTSFIASMMHEFSYNCINRDG